MALERLWRRSRRGVLEASRVDYAVQRERALHSECACARAQSADARPMIQMRRASMLPVLTNINTGSRRDRRVIGIRLETRPKMVDWVDEVIYCLAQLSEANAGGYVEEVN